MDHFFIAGINSIIDAPPECSPQLKMSGCRSGNRLGTTVAVSGGLVTGDGCIVDSCIVDGCVVAEDGSRRSSTASEPQCALIEILLVDGYRQSHSRYGTGNIG